jgi:hypothetical protein
MSTLHNRGPPAARQGPRTDQSSNNSQYRIPNNPCYPSAKRKCHLSARSLTFELNRAGAAVKHSGSCIWALHSYFRLGLLQPALCTRSRATCIVFDSSVPLQPFAVLYSEPSELPDCCPKQVVAKRHNVSDARQLSLLVGASTWRWPPKDGQSALTVAVQAMRR